MSKKSVIEEAVFLFSKLPSFGPRSAKRVILFLLKNKEKIHNLSEALSDLKHNTFECKTCHNITCNEEGCEICINPIRDPSKLCILAEVDDMWNLERTGTFNGMYHILGGNLSAISGITPEKLNFQSLFERLKTGAFKEIIFANNFSPEGATTSFYIIEEIEALKKSGHVLCDIKITELANGIPIGANLEYMDEGTIRLAFESRKNIII